MFDSGSFTGNAPARRASAFVAMVILAAWVVYSVVLGALYLVTPPNPDSSIFDYMSWRSLAGDRLYVDVIEQNWPGAVWMHMLSTALAGNSLSSFRLLDYLLLLAACLALYRLGKASGLSWTSVIAVPLYQMMYVTSTPWLTGQRDAFGAHILLIVCAFYMDIRGNWRPRWMAMFGVVCAFVVMVRPTYLLFPALIILGELLVSRKDKAQIHRLVIGALSGAAGLLGFLLVLASAGLNTGGLQGWYEAAILYNLTAYSGSAGVALVALTLLDTVKMWHWYFALAAAGAYLWYKKGSLVPWWLAMGLAITAITSFLVQGKAFGYHLAALLPVLALFVAQAIAWSFDVMARQRRSWALALLAVLILFLALAGSARKFQSIGNQAAYLVGGMDYSSYLAGSKFDFDGIGMADVPTVQEYLQANTGPEDTVLVWNRGVVINYLAERRLPVPFATVGALSEFRGESDLAAKWMSRLHHALNCTPPEYIVIGKEQRLLDAATGMALAMQRSRADEMVASVMANRYRFEIGIGGAHLWRLQKEVALSCP